MKIRTGFVSNSSSSSFIVGLKSIICPHCNLNLAEIIENISSENKYYETSIEDINNYIENSKLTIESLRQDIENYKKYPPDEKKIYDSYYVSKFTPTYGSLIESANDEIKKLENELNDILTSKLKMEKVYYLIIDYSDNSFLSLIKNLSINNQITIIRDYENVLN